MSQLTATSPEVLNALRAWHDAERGDFERQYVNLNYNTHELKTAKDGKRWIKLNRGSSGVYLVDKCSPTFDVYSIKAYGVPNRRIGTLGLMMSAWTRRTGK